MSPAAPPDGAAPGQPGARDLNRAVAGLLAAGVLPRDLARARRRLGFHVSPQQVAHDLATCFPDAHPTEPPEGLYVCQGSPALPTRLTATWEEGGPLWVWRRRAGSWEERPRVVAIVGTRRPTLDGLDLARSLARDLAGQGVEIVSGLANGIDQAAHRGALEGDGRTTAVLGTGLAIDYPRRAGVLRAQVADSGGLVTEYPDDHGVRHRTQFLHRNRILAGLADGLVVVEAGVRSGALNSASWAAGFGREVMVVPASPSAPSAAGALALLRDGAVPVRDASDVLASLGAPPDGTTPGPEQPPPSPQLEAGPAGSVRTLLGPVPAGVSALAVATGLSVREVMVAVGELEAAGHARRVAGGVVAGEGLGR